MKLIARFWLVLFLIPVAIKPLAAQEQNQHQVACIGFYNLENLFNPEDDPNKKDNEFTPTGSKLYTDAVFKDKLKNLDKIISMLGTAQSKDGVAILGVAEVENQHVLEELVKQPGIKDRNYGIVHYESPDDRGIDVGLLYNPKYFKVIKSDALTVDISSESDPDRKTRDVLWVFGLFRGEPMHVFVNHWPSRRGGEEISAPNREKAAGVCRTKIDSILNASPDHKIIVMGDMNDDPINSSMEKVLRAKGDREILKEGDMFNPWTAYYKKGIGTLAYNDAWNLFDQVVFTQNMLNADQKGFYYKEALIFKKPFMLQKSGRYKGYPLRTYDFDVYMSGYSDHFPVYLVLFKNIQ